MKILQNPNQILRKKAERIRDVSEVKNLIAKMRNILVHSAVGVALAAPQIGVSKAVIVTSYKEIENKEKKEKIIIPECVLINPKIIKSSKEKNKEEEGCLSFIDEEIRGEVERAKKVMVEALDEKDNKIKIKAEGFFARVLQHEIDHLNGILFVDRADPKTIYRITEERNDQKKI